jgi:DUF1680 family protein
MRSALAVGVALLLASAGLRAEPLTQQHPKLKAPNKAALRAFAFDLADVKLLDGPFRHAMELNRQYLLSLDADRLLHNFRINAKLPSAAEPLGGWEEPKCELRGHFVGHFLSGCALSYAATGDARLKQKADLLVAELAKCQQAVGNGYLSAYPETFFDRVEAQQRVWAPYYTLHKVYAGLLDVYQHCDNPQALEVARRFGDWAEARNARLSDEQMQKMLGNEHGGMNETLANLFGWTAEPRYLKLAQRFNHLAVIGPAAAREDKLTGLHANTQIPKFVGTARQYELTGDEQLKTASAFFWNTVVYERSYVIGGHSDGEHFSPKEKLSQALGPNTAETCNTYNTLKLTRHLFCWEPRAEYADYYERALINHILASQHPETGMTCYYVPLRPGMTRGGAGNGYCTPLHSFWCCTGTGVENHAKYGDSIYFHDGQDALYVNQFIASELDWKAKGLKLRQETKFPDEGATRLVFTCEKPTEATLHVRHPAWATEGLWLSVNTQTAVTSTRPGNYVSLKRTWKTGDVVDVAMPFSLRTEGFRDNPQRLAVMHGPLALCAEVDMKRPLPAIVAAAERIVPSLKAVPGKPSTFAGPAAVFRTGGAGDDPGVVFEPFHKMHGPRHYVVYWDVLTDAQWQAKQAERAAAAERRRRFAARTMDCVVPADRESERAHQQRGEKSGAGMFQDRGWRHAGDGGWFTYELKVTPGEPQQLCVTYWGSDAGKRVFDILVDGAKLATQKLEHNRPHEFYDELYAIPAEMTRDKQKVTIKFQAHAGATAGGVFEVRVLKPEAAPGK